MTLASADSVLVETHALSTWDSTGFRVVETAQTREAFDAGHIPGSIFWPIHELFTPDFRLRTDPAHFGDLLSRSGITPETVVVCSFGGAPAMAGWAAFLFWVLTSFGHENTVVLNGGTPKWQSEGRPITTADVKPTQTAYPTPLPFREDTRATFPHVRDAVARASESPSSSVTLLDARSQEEYRGKYFYDAPPRPGETAGHIPGAQHLPYGMLLQSNGAYRPADELHALCEELGLHADRETITYCAVGIRSALVWIVFSHLLNFPHVRNYDGSWNEWSRAMMENANAADRQEEAK